MTPIQHDQQLTLRAGEIEFAMYSRNSGEYFIIETRPKRDRDHSLPDEGLTIWHVDENGGNNEKMLPGKHYELSLEQADRDFNLETLRSHYGDSTDLFGQTSNRFADSTSSYSKWWDGTVSNLDTYEITVPGAAVSFKTRLSQDVSA